MRKLLVAAGLLVAYAAALYETHRMDSPRLSASWEKVRTEGGCFFLEQTRRNRAEIRHVLHD